WAPASFPRRPGKFQTASSGLAERTVATSALAKAANSPRMRATVGCPSMRRSFRAVAGGRAVRTGEQRSRWPFFTALLLGSAAAGEVAARRDADAGGQVALTDPHRAAQPAPDRRHDRVQPERLFDRRVEVLELGHLLGRDRPRAGDGAHLRAGALEDLGMLQQ